MGQWDLTISALLVSILLLEPILIIDGQAPDARQDDLGAYHTYDEMTQHLRDIERENPDMVRLHSIGKTFEDRDIWAIELTDNLGVKEPEEPEVLLMGGHHARELISVEVPLGILDRIVLGHDRNGTLQGIVNNFHIWLVPMLNPDGHVYVEEGHAHWRKNRRPNDDGTFGVDLNRNYGHRWGEEAIHDTTDETYCGTEAFSENETKAIRSLVDANGFDLSISYHSHGKYILYPWGNSLDDPFTTDERLHTMANRMLAWLPPDYRTSMAADFDPASGDSDDWLYADKHVLPFTIELSSSNRPDEDLVQGIVNGQLDAAIDTMVYILSNGSGQLAIGYGRPGYEGTEILDSMVDHPIDLPVELTSSLDFHEGVPLEIKIEKDGEDYWIDDYYLYFPRRSRYLQIIPFTPTEAGSYDIFLTLKEGFKYSGLDSVYIEEDNHLIFKLKSTKFNGSASGCDVEIKRYGNEGENGSMAVVSISRYGSTLILSIINNERNTVRVDVDTFLKADGVSVYLDKVSMLVDPLSTSLFSLSLRANTSFDMGSLSYVVLRFNITGSDCYSGTLLPIRTSIRIYHDLDMEDLDVKVGDGEKVIGLMGFRNRGNVDEVINLTTSDPSVLEPIYSKVTIPAHATVKVPLKVIGRVGVAVRRVYALNDAINISGKVNLEVAVSEDGDTQKVPVGLEPPLMALAVAVMVVYIRRTGIDRY